MTLRFRKYGRGNIVKASNFPLKLKDKACLKIPQPWTHLITGIIEHPIQPHHYDPSKHNTTHKNQLASI